MSRRLRDQNVMLRREITLPRLLRPRGLAKTSRAGASGPFRRRHEFGADRIGDGLRRIRSISDLAAASSDQPMTASTGSSWSGRRAPHSAIVTPWSSTQRTARSNDALAIALLREAIEPLDGGEILGEARRLELRVVSAADRRRRTSCRPACGRRAARGTARHSRAWRCRSRGNTAGRPSRCSRSNRL